MRSSVLFISVGTAPDGSSRRSKAASEETACRSSCLLEALPVKASTVIVKIQIDPLVDSGNGPSVPRLQPQPVKRRPCPADSAVIGSERYALSNLERICDLRISHRIPI